MLTKEQVQAYLDNAEQAKRFLLNLPNNSNTQISSADAENIIRIIYTHSAVEGFLAELKQNQNFKKYLVSVILVLIDLDSVILAIQGKATVEEIAKSNNVMQFFDSLIQEVAVIPPHSHFTSPREFNKSFVDLLKNQASLTKAEENFKNGTYSNSFSISYRDGLRVLEEAGKKLQDTTKSVPVQPIVETGARRFSISVTQLTNNASVEFVKAEINRISKTYNKEVFKVFTTLQQKEKAGTTLNLEDIPSIFTKPKPSRSCCFFIGGQSESGKTLYSNFASVDKIKQAYWAKKVLEDLIKDWTSKDANYWELGFFNGDWCTYEGKDYLLPRNIAKIVRLYQSAKNYDGITWIAVLDEAERILKVQQCELTESARESVDFRRQQASNKKSGILYFFTSLFDGEQKKYKNKPIFRSNNTQDQYEGDLQYILDERSAYDNANNNKLTEIPVAVTGLVLGK
jgi:hypothetical protein